MTNPHLPREQPVEGPRLPVAGGLPDLLLAAFAGSVLMPFVQAMATRAGDDLYARIRHLFRAEQRPAAEEQLSSEHCLVLVDETTRSVVRIPSAVSVAEAQALSAVRFPRQDGTWTLIAWDDARGGWTVSTVDGPPDDAIRVTGPQD